MTRCGLAEVINVNVRVPGAEDDALGPTLIGIEPLYLSKALGAWTFFHGPLIYLPVGHYDRGKLANSNVN